MASHSFWGGASLAFVGFCPQLLYCSGQGVSCMMQLFRCFFLGLTAAGLGTAAGIRARLYDVVNLAPSMNIGNSATLTVSDALNASTAVNASSAPDMATALNISTAMNDSNAARRPLNKLITEAYLSTVGIYENAILLEAQATAKRRPGSTPATLTDVRLIFSCGPYITLYQEMREWGEWGPPRMVRKAPPENDGALPLEIGMDIVEANHLLRRAGYTDKYDAVDVRIPTDVSPDLQQIYYIFSMGGDGPPLVAVAVSDGQVKPSASLSLSDGWANGNATSTN